MKYQTYGPIVNQEQTTLSNLPVAGPIENMQISATVPTGTLNIDVTTSTFWYFTSSATANFVFNFRGNSTTTFNSLIAAGQSISLVILVTQGATPYYPTSISIDGTTVTPKWLNAVVPASGNASGVDAYSLTVIKTAANTYTVLASGASKFA
jgi:hypothetical protein